LPLFAGALESKALSGALKNCWQQPARVKTEHDQMCKEIRQQQNFDS